MKKNILFFQQSISLKDGGVPRVTDVLSKELAGHGFVSFYVFYEQDNDDYPASRKLKVSLDDSFNNLAARVLDFIDKNEIKFFICQNAYSFIFIKLYKRIKQLHPSSPFISCLHASPHYWQSYNIKTGHRSFASLAVRAKTLLKQIIFPFYNPYVKTTSSLYSISDKFILLSDSFKEEFMRLYADGNSASKLYTIPNPLTFKDSISYDDLGRKEKVVLIVGRLNELQKKISVALEVWKRVSSLSNGEWKLVIVGSGPDENLYKRLVKDMNLSNVSFVGQVDNVVGYYKKASIFLMTSIWEGLPMTLLEAQQNGVVPVVFDNFSAVHDAITSEKNGYIIKGNNVDDFAKKVITLMHDGDLRMDMARMSIASSKRFSASQIGTMWQQILT